MLINKDIYGFVTYFVWGDIFGNGRDSSIVAPRTCPRPASNTALPEDAVLVSLVATTPPGIGFCDCWSRSPAGALLAHDSTATSIESVRGAG